MSRKIFGVAGIVLGSLIALAKCETATAGTITGRIVDLKGRGLADCTIEVLSAAGAVIGSAKSDTDGNYSIDLPDNAAVALYFNRDDRLSTRLNLISGSTANGKLDVVLPVKEFKFDYGPPPSPPAPAVAETQPESATPASRLQTMLRRWLRRS